MSGSGRHEPTVPVRVFAVQPERRRVISGEEGEKAVRARYLRESQKRALHETIHHSTAPLKAIADEVGVEYSSLANAALMSRTDQLPFARLPLVLEACDDLTLLRFFAHLQGCDVFRLPRVGAAGDAHQAAATMREFAELLEAGAAAAEDNVVTPEEFARVEREAQDVVRAVLEYVAHYRARVRRPLLEGV